MLKKIGLLSIVAMILIGNAAPAGSEVLKIVGTAFRPVVSGIGFNSTPPAIWAVNGTGYFEAPVYLPQGAIVTSLRMYYFNGTSIDTCFGSLMFYDITNHSGSSVGEIGSLANCGYYYSDSDAFSHTIDYTKYAYALRWYPMLASDLLQLLGFQITYTPPPSRAAVIPLN